MRIARGLLLTLGVVAAAISLIVITVGAVILVVYLISLAVR